MTDESVCDVCGGGSYSIVGADGLHDKRCPSGVASARTTGLRFPRWAPEGRITLGDGEALWVRHDPHGESSSGLLEGPAAVTIVDADVWGVLRGIVSDLAARNPWNEEFDQNDMIFWWCSMCSHDAPLDDDDNIKDRADLTLDDHAPSCVWRRAQEAATLDGTAATVQDTPGTG